MTAVLSFVQDGMPILIGDLLLSTDSAHAPKSVVLPTVGRIAEFETFDARSSLAGLKQKLIVLAPNLAAGWAGHAYSARNILGAVRTAHAAKPFTRDTIFPFLQSNWHDICVNESLSLVFHLVDEQGLFVASVGTRIEKTRSKTLGEVRLAGSGAWDLYGNLQDLEDFPALGGNGQSLYQAFSTAIALIGYSLKHELHHMDSLRWSYGGGYELLAHWDNSFRKLPELTQVMWRTEYKNNRIVLKEAYFVIKQTYINDTLVIRSLMLNQSADGTPLFSRHFRVSPILEIEPPSTEANGSEVLPLHSSTYAHFVLVRQGTKATIFTMIQNCQPDRFQIEECGGRIIFNAASDFAAQLELQINRAIP